MLLSIVIPTFNRHDMLKDTVPLIEREIRWLPKELSARLEFIVADNASDDGTRSLFVDASPDSVRYQYFSEHVGIAESIARAISLTSAQYVWVFGDDDYIPAGFLRDVVERLLAAEGDVALLYFNRLIVDWKFQVVKNIAHPRWEMMENHLPMGEFVRLYSHWPGFVTSMVFRRATYEAGEDFEKDSHDGWRFLARIYFGGRAERVWVVNYPSLTQRLGVHAWKANWPRYWLVNMPNLLSDLEAAGVTSEAVKHWRDHEVSLRRITIDAVVAKVFEIKSSDSFWKDSARYQSGLKRLILMSVRWFMPCWAARVVYRLQPKYRRK